MNRQTDNHVYFWKRVLFTTVPFLLLLIFYTRWLLLSAPDQVWAKLAAAAITFLFIVCGIRFIPQWMNAWSTRPWLPIRPVEGKRSARVARMHPFFSIIFALCAFRLALFVMAYLMTFRGGAYTGGVFDTLSVWNAPGTDSRHFLNIAENWYTAVGDDRMLIVFFPLYPILVRIANYAFGSYLTSGLFVSNLCCVFAGYVFYELALLDTDRKTALRSLKYLCILPASFLLSAPLSDSLLLLLSVCCVYFTRRRSYALAGFMGFFAAFTRLPGVLLLVPMLMEYVGCIVREHPRHRNDRTWLWHTVGDGLAMLLVPAGFLLYLYVNYSVTGNALMFLTYQQAHWHQSLGWFFSTAATQLENFLTSLAENREMAFGLWLPNLVSLFASLGIVTAAQNKLRASNVAYFIAYFAVCMGATWLLSAPRYLTACFPLAMALGTLTEDRRADILATILCCMLLVLYMLAYVNQWYVY